MGFADDNGISNQSDNPTFADLMQAGIGRRGFLLGGLATAASFFAGSTALAGVAGALTPAEEALGVAAGGGSPLLSFSSVAFNGLDTVTVPPGYRVYPAFSWGEPVNGVAPAWKPDASNTTDEQAQQFGMHHDGIHFFPIDPAQANTEGLLVMNHEYTDDGLLHVGGMEPWTADKVAKSQAAHGVSVAHIRKDGDTWRAVDSHYARRISVHTPMTFTGAAAGHRLLQTAADPSGTDVVGTANNCAHGVTPWGTYLTCEENFNGYFNATAGTPDQRRYGLAKDGFGYRWHEHDERFDADKHPNEPYRFGWVVEINPWDSSSTPTKRTALGRFKHEGAFCTEAPDGRVVVYSGDDERFEYIYKFVSAAPWRQMLADGTSPLDEGTLYVARFAADGTGSWLPLVWGQGPLTPANGFADQGEVLIRARSAGDALGATKMDRPEWITQNPMTRAIYCALTNNSQRGTTGRAPTDAANPRAATNFGHIIRWQEADLDQTSTTFSWEIFVLAGDPKLPDANKQGNINGDTFASADGLWFDSAGRLWIQTDNSSSALGRGDYVNIPTNMMLAADPVTREVKRFLVAPPGCEVTGVITTPDRRTMFVNIQHPGEGASDRSDPAKPTQISSWPGGPGSARPRSSTIVIEKLDGGEIGS